MLSVFFFFACLWTSPAAQSINNGQYSVIFTSGLANNPVIYNEGIKDKDNSKGSLPAKHTFTQSTSVRYTATSRYFSSNTAKCATLRTRMAARGISHVARSAIFE